MSVLAVCEGGALSSGREPVHREHLTRLHANLEKPNPVGPEGAEGFVGQRIRHQIRAESSPKQHLGAINIPDSRNNFLIHERSTDWCSGSLDPCEKPVFAFCVDERVGSEVIANFGHPRRADHLAHGRAAQIGDSAGSEDSNAYLPNGVGREGAEFNPSGIVFAHAKSRATRRSD